VGGTGGELCNFPHSYINLDHFAGRERRENTLETRDKSLRKKTEIKSWFEGSYSLLYFGVSCRLFVSFLIYCTISMAECSGSEQRHRRQPSP